MDRFVETWSKYLEVSSIHGLIYLSQRSSTKYRMQAQFIVENSDSW